MNASNRFQAFAPSASGEMKLIGPKLKTLKAARNVAIAHNIDGAVVKDSAGTIVYTHVAR